MKQTNKQVLDSVLSDLVGKLPSRKPYNKILLIVAASSFFIALGVYGYFEHFKDPITKTVVREVHVDHPKTDWSKLDRKRRSILAAQSFVFFPEIFSNRRDKYHRVESWLSSKGILTANVRDIFSSGGRRTIVINGNKQEVPRVFYNFYKQQGEVLSVFSDVGQEALTKHWGVSFSTLEERINHWKTQVSEMSRSDLPADILDYGVQEFLVQ